MDDGELKRVGGLHSFFPRDLQKMSTSELPVVVLFSGKRKSGKDYIVECLEKKWSERGASVPLSVMRLSGPLKGDFAKNEGTPAQYLIDISFLLLSFMPPVSTFQLHPLCLQPLRTCSFFQEVERLLSQGIDREVHHQSFF